MRFHVTMDRDRDFGPMHWGHGDTLAEAVRNLMKQVLANGTKEQRAAVDESLRRPPGGRLRGQ